MTAAAARRTAQRGVDRAQLEQVVRELQRRQAPADLHPKQRLAFESVANEILYGGAAGSGKSHLFRRAAITWCRWVPGLQVYLFRRTFPDLFKNHMEGPSSFPVLLGELIDRGEVRIVWARNQIRFRNGAVIHLCHCQYEKDVYNYQGAEIHVLMIDELTHWSRRMYTFLRSRVRLGALKVAAWLKHLFPRILNGANPGGIGHNWVKADFVDVAPPMAITPMPDSEGGMQRQFIPARLDDNPTMAENDPKYAGRLRGLHDPALAEAMLAGNWDIVSGGMFDDVWKRDVHVLKPFAIPKSWRIDRSFDWGSSKPFSVGWWAESDGTPALVPSPRLGKLVERHFPRGTLIRIAEWYGCVPGRPNEGLKLTAKEIAKEILDRERGWRLRHKWNVQPGPADSSIYSVEDGPSIADNMEVVGVKWLKADKSPGSRHTGWEAIRGRLKAARDNPREEPGLYVFDSCVDWIRTVPTLPRDEKDREDVDTKAEDHTGDETRYRLLAPAAGQWGSSQYSR